MTERRTRRFAAALAVAVALMAIAACGDCEAKCVGRALVVRVPASTQRVEVCEVGETCVPLTASGGDPASGPIFFPVAEGATSRTFEVTLTDAAGTTSASSVEARHVSGECGCPDSYEIDLR